MDTVNILIKPASLCNLRCKYCFYEDVSALRSLSGNGLMSHETLEILVREAYASAERRVIFSFQGGEPTLAGLDFFKKFIELEKQYKKPGVSTEHSIQTNGILIDREWADFFRDNNFLVGLSIDGTAELHNANRVDSGGRGTFAKLQAAYSLLARAGVDINVLCVVTNNLARRAQAVYESLKKMGCRFMQFIPCLDPHNEDASSLTPEKYSVFLKTLFDLWFNDWERGDYVSIRLFDDYVHILTGIPAASCASSGMCGQYFVAESDGTLYPCDFYTVGDWDMGKIGKSPLDAIARGEVALAFIKESEKYPDECTGCGYFPVCRGGCRRNRGTHDGAIINHYCTAFRGFFDYAMPRLSRIAALEKQQMMMRGGRSF